MRLQFLKLCVDLSVLKNMINQWIQPQMQALHDVVQAGYARYIGMSSCWAWQCTCEGH